MTSAAEGGGGRNADKGRGGLSLADVSKKYLSLGKNCFKSSAPITMRETTAFIYFHN